MKKLFASLIVGMAGVANGIVVMAQETGLIPCSGPDCTFEHLVTLINNIIQFALFNIAIPVTVGVIIWAGILIMTAGGDTGKVGKARSMITGTVIGLGIAFGAWLIVETITNLIFSV